MKRRIFLYLTILVMVSILFVGCQPTVPAPSGSPSVQGTIDLAKKTTSSAERDSILLSGVGNAQTVGDIKALAVSCVSSSNRDNILLQGIKLAQDVEGIKTLASACVSSSNRDQILLQGFNQATNVDEVLTLAKHCVSSSNRDQLLLQGTKFADTNGDYAKLAQACVSSSNRDRILSRASAGSSSVNGPPSDEVNQAYKDMQAAYAAYQKGMADKVSNSQLKTLAEDYKKKKAKYDALIKN
jgi:hypothetical protein